MVHTPIKPANSPAEIKVSKLEGIKERSQFLREPVATELQQDTTHFTEEGIQILKFHGSYQQDNRDNRIRGQEKDYSMMLRLRNPGGYISPQLYLTLDDISDKYGNNTLRATTRQAFQLHGILKKNLKATLADIIRSMGSTLGACGDLSRNVMAPPAPYTNKPEYVLARKYATNIADLLTPQTPAYYEIWLDGEKVVTTEEDPDVVAAREGRSGLVKTEHGKSIEPIYGTQYMPRKFKCAVTVPGDNSVDAYTQDITLVVITDENKELLGFNVMAGGGMGRTHNKEETFARTADHVGYVAKEDVYDLVKAIVFTQRDYGERYNRRISRMKYLVHHWGLPKFIAEIEKRMGKQLEPYRELPEWKFEDYLGWHEQGDGKLFVGVHVRNGRVHNQGKLRNKAALKEIVETFNVPMRVTPNQSVILCDIEPDDKAAIQKILDRDGITPDSKVDSLERYSMACPALPTCGLAVTESERIIPSMLERIRKLLIKLGLRGETFVIRMTGCPNGCARPYMAELGFVGQAPKSYQLWLGGSPNQTRLARPYMEKLHEDSLEEQLEPLFACFKQNRNAGESFGDFCDRYTFTSLRQFTETYTPVSPVGSGRRRNRVGVSDELFAKLKAKAIAEGKSMTDVLEDAVRESLG
ncbi:MAG: sulfite reductase, ferredoxin dependent [Phormidesmis sp.]